MKPNYKNWLPRGLLIGAIAGTVVIGLLLVIVLAADFVTGSAKIAVGVILGILFTAFFVYSAFCVHLYNSFSYNGKTQLSRRIIEKISDYVVLPENGVGLDIGCGSGALTIACAKKNRHASMIGLDRWGKEYASYNKPLCENNAVAEGVSDNTSFVQGDACKLEYPDGQFDAVTSNYCYHNIPSRDRQKIILETLRVLKKGGIFAIHDEFTKSKYGDMDLLVKKLQNLGYEQVELLDTSDGLFMTRKEAGSLCLIGSALLVGKK